MALCVARAPNGGLLGRLADGRLGLAATEADTSRLVVARVGPHGDCFVEAPGRTIRLDDSVEARPVLALRAIPQAGLTAWQDANGRPLVLQPTGVLRPTEAATDAAACFTLERIEGAVPDCLLASLPDEAGLDLDGLTAIIRSGNAALLPAAEAVLGLLDAAQGRRAWTECPRTPAQDVFHPLLRAHGHQGLYRFGGYTADLLREQIDRHGWSIGKHTYGRPLMMETGRGKLTIGRFCSLADPTIVLGNHGTRSASSYPFLDMWVEWPGTTVDLADHVARDVVIGNDVWIGVGAIILPGAVIGDGAVIGAGTVVRGTVPPYAICIGNPGRVDRYRHDERTIARLLRIAWWHWPDGMIDRYIPLLLSGEVERFADVAEMEGSALKTHAAA